MITVIAGVNGAGKSSVAGASIRRSGNDYFNSDEVARRLVEKKGISINEANGEAWQMGFNFLNKAIALNEDYTFETTLGGNSICQALHGAIDIGIDVRIFYCGLTSVELHIQRVAERVANGGHNIPEAKIRQRSTNSIHNMMGLIPRCSAVKVFDNSSPKDESGANLVCLFSLAGDTFDITPAREMPDWAKPLASEAIKKATG